MNQQQFQEAKNVAISTRKIQSQNAQLLSKLYPMQTHTPYCFLLLKSCALRNNVGEM
jgi:hypothetical protein